MKARLKHLPAIGMLDHTELELSIDNVIIGTLRVMALGQTPSYRTLDNVGLHIDGYDKFTWEENPDIRIEDGCGEYQTDLRTVANQRLQFGYETEETLNVANELGEQISLSSGFPTIRDSNNLTVVDTSMVLHHIIELVGQIADHNLTSLVLTTKSYKASAEFYRPEKTTLKALLTSPIHTLKGMLKGYVPIVDLEEL